MLFRLASFLVCLVSLGVDAQDGAPSRTWNSVGFYTGAFVDHRAPMFRGSLADLAPGSSFLANDLRLHRFRQQFPALGASWSVQVGLLPFRREDRLGPELRVGFITTSPLGINGILEKESYVRFDTLTSSTGISIPLDSIYTDEYRIEHRYRMTGVHGALTWRTKARFSWYGGIGIGVGAIHGAHTTVRYHTESVVRGDGYSSRQNYNRPENDPEEEFANGSGSWFQWHVPVGFTFQLHRSNRFWSRVQLGHEVALQMLYAQRPVLGTTAGFGLQFQFGVRIRL